MGASVCVRALCAVVAAGGGLAAAACPPCPPTSASAASLGRGCKALENPAMPDQCRYKIKDITNIVTYNVRRFELKCVEGLTLEEPSLPRFPRRVSVPVVSLAGCAPPRAGSFADALARLNVSALDELLLLRLPARPPLRARHLAGLRGLSALHVTAATRGARSLHIDDTEASIFSPLNNLTNLTLVNVRLPATALTSISSQSLSSLELFNAGLKELPMKYLCTLPHLRSLIVQDRELESFPSVCNLTFLTLGRSNLSRLPPVHSIVSLTYSVNSVTKLEDCTSLKYLTVTCYTASTLPARWAGGCARLEELKLTLLRVTALTNRTFSGAVALKKLTIDSSRYLSVLEQGLFREARNIEELILSRNSLTTFPADLFSPLTNLKSLDLSHNLIHSGALEALSGLPLRRLWLTDNPLGDLCPPRGTIVIGKRLSVLVTIPTLEMLSLENTRAERICPDWRQDLTHINKLDLQNNNITKLTWEDLRWGPRDHVTEVRLSGNALAAITVTPEQYNNNRNNFKLTDIKVKFILDNLDKKKPFHCDCNFYWFAKALREGVLSARFENLRCAAASGRSVPFDRIEPRDMVCRLENAQCPTNCTCVQSPEAGGEVAECGGRGLRALPPAAAHALFAAGRRLRLGGNPLLCACDQPLMLQIRDHTQQVIDLPSVTCADGRSMLEAIGECFESTAEAGPDAGVGVRKATAGGAEPWAWAAGGAALALLAAGALLGALRPEGRLRLKAFLLARGLCLWWARPKDDDGFKYDAFLSYAHEDSAVAGELLAGLEAGGLRLCVHHRDWRPGDWIPAQIIESVSASRRTLVLLSAAFVRSGWARAEFREAYARALRDGAARLLVVLLDDAPAPPAMLDPEMRHYVTHNTYVRWGEPAFWDKLRAALPPKPPPAPRRSPRRHRPRRRSAPPPSGAAIPVPPPPPAPQTPPTPIVKFAQIDFPTPNKPLKQGTSPCA